MVSPYDRPLALMELRNIAADADALVTLLHDRVDAELLDAAGSRLRCVANVAVDHDNIDVDEARVAGRVITNTPGVLTDATIALLLAPTRRVGESEPPAAPGCTMGATLHATARVGGLRTLRRLASTARAGSTI